MTLQNDNIPSLSEQVDVHELSSCEYLVHQREFGYQILVNAETKYLLSLIDGFKNYEEITALYNNESGKKFNSEQLRVFLDDKFKKYGIIKSSQEIAYRPRASYLKLSLLIIPAQVVRSIAERLSFFYSSRLFYLLLSFSLLFLITTIARYSTVVSQHLDNITGLNITFYLIVAILSGILHEFGHATACEAKGANCGGIGFGFYLFSPVLFCDVSDAWKLKKQDRIIINLGGIYFEMLLGCLLLLCYYATGHEAMLIIPCIFFVKTLNNLVPVLRSDGYWILSDSLNIPNLSRKSMMKTEHTILTLLQWKKPELKSRKEVFLLTYGVILIVSIYLVLSLLVIHDPYSILHFPIDIIEYIKFQFGTVNAAVESNNKLTKLIAPALFYFILIRTILIKVWHHWQMRKKQQSTTE